MSKQNTRYKHKFCKSNILSQFEYDYLGCIQSKQQNGVEFRRWATSVLKDYMLKGYAVNQKRLEYLEKAVKSIDIVIGKKEI